MSRGWGGWFAYCIAITAVTAGLTHLLAVLVLPGRSPTSAYASLAKAVGGATLKTSVQAWTEAFPDPGITGAACLYDLRQGPVSVSLAVNQEVFAVLSVHDRNGRVLAGLTSRAVRDGRLALTVTAEDTTHRPQEPRSGTSADITVDAMEPQGFARAAVLARAPSEQADAAALAASLTCRPAAP